MWKIGIIGQVRSGYGINAGLTRGQDIIQQQVLGPGEQVDPGGDRAGPAGAASLLTVSYSVLMPKGRWR